MKQFSSIEKIDTGILYALELTSSISVLLLAFGLIASMANVLTKGSVLTDNLFMQRIWAWTQCIAIDASVAGTIIRTFRYYARHERIKYILYGFLSVLLLFTAAIVSNIESVQQTLNIALDQAYMHVFVPVEALIWIRSLAIVLLIVAHALRHVQREGVEPVPPSQALRPSPSLVVTPELVDTLRDLLAQTTVSQEANMPYASPQDERGTNTAQEATGESDDDHGTNNHERVKAYLVGHPDAKVRDVARALKVSVSTANKWMIRIRGEYLPRECCEPDA